MILSLSGAWGAFLSLFMGQICFGKDIHTPNTIILHHKVDYDYQASEYSCD